LLARDISIEQIWIWWWFGVQYVENLLYQQTQKEYPQNKRSYGTDTVQELLDTEIEQWLSFAQYLRESMTILHLEPGRSLLDQCGICIHHIIDKKNNQLFIDGNMYSLGSIGQEMPHDPLIYKKSIDWLSQDYREYEIYGNLCMEFDRIYTRNIILPKNIELWDMLIFINIAAYFVDFSDSQPIKHNKRREIIV
jgi:diaminopimelate decarboxylase